MNGALAGALAEGKSNEQAVEFACVAAGLTVTRMGAQSSVPYRAELSSDGMEQYAKCDYGLFAMFIFLNAISCAGNSEWSETDCRHF